MTSETEHLDRRAKPARRPLWQKTALAWAARCRYGQLTLTFPNGESHRFEGSEPGPEASMTLHNGGPIRAMLTRGRLGIAESYMDGDWETPDLTAVAKFALTNGESLEANMRGAWWARALAFLRFRLQNNSRAGARRNISYHYDLGNDFYAAWLDETMTYSSAFFLEPGNTLAEAQRNKYRRIIETLDIRPGDRVLEIGCGWGGFAELAAKEAGAEIVGLTISKEQAVFARERMDKAGSRRKGRNPS